MPEKVPCPECARPMRPKHTKGTDFMPHHHNPDGVRCDGTGAVVNEKPRCEDCDTDYCDKLSAPASAPEPETEKGPWFGAMYEGRCSTGHCLIYEGDRIRADGEGGYECENCGDVELVPDYQALASAAAKRHVAAMAADPVDQYVIASSVTPVPEPDPFVKPTVVQLELNVSGQPASRRDYLGRYMVIDPKTGDFKRAKNGNVQGFTRVTTFVKSASDSKALNDWGKRSVLIGAAMRPDLVDSAKGMTHADNRDELARLVNELETAAGAKVAADIGTKLHEFTELMDAGLKTWQDAPSMYQQQLYAYGEELRQAGFEPVPGMIERTVMVRGYGVVGKFDRVLLHRPSGTYVVGDLKTGKTLDYAMDEIQAQVWCYAEGVNENGVYDWNTDTWESIWEGFGVPNHMPPLTRVRTDIGLIIHMPVQGDLAGQVRLVKADLESGARYAQVCADTRARKRPPQELWTVDTLPSERDWGKEFGDVRNGAEAGALWEEARAGGVNPMMLQELVKIAQTALRSRG